MAEITTDKELNLKVKLKLDDLESYYYWIERNAFFKLRSMRIYRY